MPPPSPIRLFHFTHLDNLPSIVVHGLVCDAQARSSLLQREAGNPAIKDRRRRRAVGVPPGGVVADYVPFYFAPHNSMMYSIYKGRVVTFGGDYQDLACLSTTVDRLEQLRLPFVMADRNAATELADFAAEREVWSAPGWIDWELMKSASWGYDPEFPERKERRMAECLVHGTVPWHAIEVVGAADERRATRVLEQVADASWQPDVRVTRAWYL